MSVLPLSKKKRVIRIIIIIASLVETKLNNDEEDTVYEQILNLTGEAQPLLFDVPENEWTSEQQGAWDAIEAIADAYGPEAPSDPSEQDLQTMADALSDALEQC